jgi:hypothetical protein
MLVHSLKAWWWSGWPSKIIETNQILIWKTLSHMRWKGGRKLDSAGTYRAWGGSKCTVQCINMHENQMNTHILHNMYNWIYMYIELYVYMYIMCIYHTYHTYIYTVYRWTCIFWSLICSFFGFAFFDLQRALPCASRRPMQKTLLVWVVITHQCRACLRSHHPQKHAVPRVCPREKGTGMHQKSSKPGLCSIWDEHDEYPERSQLFCCEQQGFDHRHNRINPNWLWMIFSPISPL